jgi:hypothetical protein
MKEHIIKHYEIIFAEIKFPQTTYEDKMGVRQAAVQYLSKQDRFIYIQQGKKLVKPFCSDFLMCVLNILFVGPKARFPHVLRGLKSVSLPMLGLACMWVSVPGHLVKELNGFFCLKSVLEPHLYRWSFS